MSYRIESGEAFGDAVHRIAREQADKAIDELGREGEPVSWRVHQLRMRCKKIRAAARLVRSDFDDYGSCNRYFRDLAKTVGEARDARIRYELVTHVSGSGSDEFGDPARWPLLRWHELGTELADADAERRLPALQEAMAQGAAAIKVSKLSAVGAASVLEGLGRNLARARRAYRSVGKCPDADHFHELRKRCKYHWYHLRLLRALLPHELAQRESTFDELGELLGDAHDRSMYLAYREQLPAFLADQPSSRFIFDRVFEERQSLREEALKLCESALELSPEALRRRLEDHWNRESA